MWSDEIERRSRLSGILRDIEGMIRFLQTAFPEFQVRGEGRNQNGTRWVHIGTNETYSYIAGPNRNGK